MYTTYGDSYVARVVSNEKRSLERESISLHLPGVWMNTLQKNISRVIESMQVPQAACPSNPQFC